MRISIIAMLHQGHVAVTKMDKAAEAFWWPGRQRGTSEKSENCPSCSAAVKNRKTKKTYGIKKIRAFNITEPRKSIGFR